jgi:hypothetical protein
MYARDRRWHVCAMETPIEYPAHFRGIYDQIRARHAPLLTEAVTAIRDLQIPADLTPSLAYQTWNNPQPSFILFPLMFLATAETTGGITQKHLQYLPTIMLFSELLAVADDTVDRSARRSGRETFARKFGDASALPFAVTLASLVIQQSRRCDLRLMDAVVAYFGQFFPLELWERAHTFPMPDQFSPWLEHRYAQASWSTQFVLDAALILNESATWATSAVDALNRIGQDVDDIVNVVEFREADGENDDLMCGVVTRPMVLAIDARPELAAQIAALWDRHRPLATQQLSIASYQEHRVQLIQDTLPAYVPIRQAILETGVPATVRACLADLRTSVHESPEPLRPLMRGLATGFLDRLRALNLVEVRA